MKTLLIFILLIISYQTQGQDLLKIRKVSFKGNTAIGNAKLKEQISMKAASSLVELISRKEADLFTMSLYRHDVDRLTNIYQKEGYLKINFPEPTLKVTRNNKLNITFNIKEGRPIKISGISYTVDSANIYKEITNKKTRREIRLQSQLKEKRRFRDEWFYEDKSLINNEFNNIGYAFSKVNHHLTVDTINNTTKVNWNINKGRLTYFGPVTVVGNKHVPLKKITKQITFKQGDLWSSYKLDQTQRNIYNLGMFRVASVKALMNESKQDTLSILITLKEAPRWITRTGIGYGREENLRIFGELHYLGFITNIGRLKLYAKHSSLEPYNFQMQFIQPAILSYFNSLTINPFLIKQHEPAYRITRKGINIKFLQHISLKFNSSLNFYVEDVDSDTTIVFHDDHQKSISDYSKSGVSFGFVYFNGEPRLDPAQGFSVAANFKRNGTFIEKSIPFYRNIIEIKKYIGITQGTTLALKGKIGFAKMQNSNEMIPVEERFYAGGSHSVRGWKRAELGPHTPDGIPTGGNSLLEGSAEYRYYIAPRLLVATFLDAGNIWQKSFYYRLNDMHFAAGLSFRFKTPIGPIGVDFGRPVFDTEKHWQIHFNIGHPF